MTGIAQLDQFDQIRRLARVWGGHDDWGVANIYVGTLDKILGWIEAGVPVEDIEAHASHTNDCTSRCERMNLDRGRR